MTAIGFAAAGLLATGFTTFDFVALATGFATVLAVDFAAGLATDLATADFAAAFPAGFAAGRDWGLAALGLAPRAVDAADVLDFAGAVLVFDAALAMASKRQHERDNSTRLTPRIPPGVQAMPADGNHLIGMRLSAVSGAFQR
ncbi:MULTISPECIES: hypothetical protein [unclassified Bradyrhizobium]|uniref:hypothetical protein n=1 Tax=unclassified Bradyrhizobium TaxID=2631580 RepID=UPI0032E4FA02